MGQRIGPPDDDNRTFTTMHTTIAAMKAQAKQASAQGTPQVVWYDLDSNVVHRCHPEDLPRRFKQIAMYPVQDQIHQS